MGFEVWACRAYRPQTKGKVEALAKLTSRLMPYNHEFDSVEDLAAIVREVNQEINSKISGNYNEGITGAKTIKTLVV